MEKYGYKNISTRSEFEQASAKDGSHSFSYNSGEHIGNYGFINWGDQNQWGSPGQSKYSVKTVDQLLNAGKTVSETSK